MQIQLEFRSRDILKQACQLRLTGTKDLLQHFVQNNATNYTHDMHRDDIWEMMAEITLPQAQCRTRHVRTSSVRCA